MEENRIDQEQQPLEEVTPAPEEGYVPRPAWQVWAARVGLVLFILFVIYQMIQLAGGGL